MVLDAQEKQTIIQHINAFTDAKRDELFVEIDGHINSIFKHDNNGTAVPIIGCLFSRVLELKRKIRETVAIIIASRDAAEAAQEDIAKRFRYLIKQDAYVYLFSKFKDDIETLFSSAISVTRSINSLIAAHTKQEPAVTLSDTLSSIINTMRAFMPPITDDQIALWLTKLPFPILISRAELQKRIFSALINRATGGNREGEIYEVLTELIKELNRDNTAFSADTVLARLPAAAAAAAPVDAIPIANEFRKFTALDWCKTITGEPMYPYYLLLDNAGGYRHPECPAGVVPNLATVSADYGSLSGKQPSRIKALGYTEELVPTLQLSVAAAPSDAAQKILKRLAELIGTIVVSSVALLAPAAAAAAAEHKGGRRYPRRSQKGGSGAAGPAYNESFRNITVWDMNNFDFTGLCNTILDVKMYHSMAGGAAAAPAVPSHPFLESTVITTIKRSPIADFFYKTEAYLYYCFDYVEESNNEILIADYTNMLITLSELRLGCFIGELSEPDLLIELACILLIEDDRFPSVFSTIQYNRGFNKSFLYTPLRGFLAGTQEADELLEIFNDIFSAGGPVAGDEPSLAEINEGINKLIIRMYRVIPNTTFRDLLNETAGSRWRAADADLRSESFPVALGGAGGGAVASTPAELKQKEYNLVALRLATASQELYNLQSPPPGMFTPDKAEEAIKKQKIASLTREISLLEETSKRLLKELEQLAVAKGPRKGGFRRTRSLIGKKRTTRKATASSKGRRTRRRK
jgi:hypothetical protein